MADPSKQDGIFVNMAAPFENMFYRPFTDTGINDYRYLGTGSTTDGSSYNWIVTRGGKGRRRPHIKTTVFGATSTSIISGKRIDRLWNYESLPTTTGSTYRYYLASVYNLSSTLWEMYYWDLQSPGWTKFTNTRDCNSSSRAHWVVVHQGLAYVKGFPGSGLDKLGTIIFDASTGTPAYRWWGALGPTTPVRVTGFVGKLNAAITETTTSLSVAATTAPSTAAGITIYIDLEQITGQFSGASSPYTFTVSARGANGTRAVAHKKYELVIYRTGTSTASDWSASDHNVDVYYGWRYAIAYETSSRHVTNISPFETNPDQLPSNTGPFADLIPKMTAPTTNDTTNVPYLWMFRTTDGSKVPYKLERFANPGGTSFTYEDDSLGSGGSGTTYKDPQPDTALDVTAVGDLEINSPPPTVNLPLVVGTDIPSINATKIVMFARRAWYGIDNVLWYSGEEEIRYGNTIEAWPSGLVRGNKITFQSRINLVEATRAALYVMCGDGTVHIITGSDRDSFQPRQISDRYPTRQGVYTASVAFLDRVAFVTNSYQVAVITGESIDVISDPILFLQQPQFATTIQCFFHTDQARQYLMFHFGNNNGGKSLTWIYDWQRSQLERRDFWFPPWESYINTMLASDDLGLICAMYDPAGATKSSGIAAFDFDDTAQSGQDDGVISNNAWSVASFTFRAVLGPFKNPAGNHINVAAIPIHTTVPSLVTVDYYAAGLAGAIGVEIIRDCTTLATTEALTGRNPRFHEAPTGYSTKEYRTKTASKDFAISIGRGEIPPDATVEVRRVAIGAIPEAGGS